MKRKIIALSVVCLLAFACKNTDNKKGSDTTTVPVENTEAVATGDNTRNSIDWAGIYKGTTPCADCDGIETSLLLNRDGTYQLTTTHLGKTESREQVTKGNFIWDTDGSVITLQGIKDGPTRYQVGEDVVVQYDMQGKEITGASADKYILSK